MKYRLTITELAEFQADDYEIESLDKMEDTDRNDF